MRKNILWHEQPQPGLIIRVNDCPNTSTVDSKRIALREEGQGGGLGKLVMFSRT